MKFLRLLLLSIAFSFSAFSNNIDNIIEIQIITNTASKTYYTIFSEDDNLFIFYDSLH